MELEDLRNKLDAIEAYDGFNEYFTLLGDLPEPIAEMHVELIVEKLVFLGHRFATIFHASRLKSIDHSDFFYSIDAQPSKFIALLLNQISPNIITDTNFGISNPIALVYNNPNIQFNTVEHNPAIRNFIKSNFSKITVAEKLSKETDLECIITALKVGRNLASSNFRTYEEEELDIIIDRLSHRGYCIVEVPMPLLALHSFEKIRNKLISNSSKICILPIKNAFGWLFKSLIIFQKGTGLEKVDFLSLDSSDDTFLKYVSASFDFSVPVSELKSILTYGFNNPANNVQQQVLSNFKTVRLESIAKIISSPLIHSTARLDDGPVRIITGRNIKDKTLIDTERDKYLDFDSYQGKLELLEDGDVIIRRINTKNIEYTLVENAHKSLAADQSIIVIRSSIKGYFASYLETINGSSIFEEQIKNVEQLQLSIKYLSGLEVPIMSFSDLSMFDDNVLKELDAEELDGLKNELSELQITFPSNSENDLVKTLLQLTEKLNEKLDKTLSRLDVIESKLDKALSLIIGISDQMQVIKSKPSNVEQKLTDIENLLEKSLLNVSDEIKKRDYYISNVKDWLQSWDLLDDQSKQFIPEAEFLFDQLSNLKDGDFSPFVVQYSRALENELLLKLFVSFHDYSKANNIKELLEDGLRNNKTKKFATMLAKDDRKYTLGSMTYILGLLKPTGNTYTNSLLLQRFKSHIDRYLENNIIEKEYIKSLDLIISDYRNKAAHPSIIDIDLAKEFHEKIKIALSTFIDAIKNS